MTSKIEIFDQKFAHFGGFGGSFLTILDAEEVVFWPFSKVDRSCLEIVWALFLDCWGIAYTLCYP